MIQRTFLRNISTAARQSQQCISKSTRTSPFISPSLSVSAIRVAPAQQLSQRRAYSETAEAKKEEKADDKAAETKSSEAASENPVQKELDGKKAEVIDLTDRIKRSVADYRNLQEQTKREVQAAKDFALQRFAKDLLDSIDNLDRALINVPKEKLTEENKDLVNLHDGLKMTETILLQTLNKHGLERFDPAEASDKFDPNKMEATFQAPQQGKEDGTVFYTQSKGFTLNGRVLRAAKVGVVKNA